MLRLQDRLLHINCKFPEI